MVLCGSASPHLHHYTSANLRQASAGHARDMVVVAHTSSVRAVALVDGCRMRGLPTHMKVRNWLDPWHWMGGCEEGILKIRIVGRRPGEKRFRPRWTGFMPC
jgi:hypothetical protein